MFLSRRINPSVTAKVTASPKATFSTFFLLISTLESVTCLRLAPQKGCPLMWVSLSWLGAVCDTVEPLRNRRGSHGNSQVSVDPCKCSLFWPFLMLLIIACHFCSLTKAILIFPGFRALRQHFPVLKVPKHTVFISTLTILYLYHIPKQKV